MEKSVKLERLGGKKSGKEIRNKAGDGRRRCWYMSGSGRRSEILPLLIYVIQQKQ
jgi:hypothetical protein